MFKVGIISDTHSLLRPQAIEVLSRTDFIIHAGDIGSIDVIHQLREIAPVTAIRGNIDKGQWASEFSDDEVLEIDGRQIYIIHNLFDLDLDPVVAGFDVVVSGHSHKPSIERLNGVLYVNPGSAGPRRFSLPIAVAQLELKPETIDVRVVELAA